MMTTSRMTIMQNVGQAQLPDPGRPDITALCALTDEDQAQLPNPSRRLNCQLINDKRGPSLSKMITALRMTKTKDVASGRKDAAERLHETAED